MRPSENAYLQLPYKKELMLGGWNLTAYTHSIKKILNKCAKKNSQHTQNALYTNALSENVFHNNAKSLNTSFIAL